MPQYTRTTIDYFTVQVYHGRQRSFRRDGWYDLHTETTSAAAYVRLKAYRQQDCRECRYRIVKRRK